MADLQARCFLELANQLRGKKRDGYSVWLVWDDAEESIKLTLK